MILCNKISRASSPATGPTASSLTVPLSSASSPTTGTEIEMPTVATSRVRVLVLLLLVISREFQIERPATANTDSPILILAGADVQ